MLNVLLYQGGVYKHREGNMVGGHAVKMIGWGDDPVGGPYWVCLRGEKSELKELNARNWGTGFYFMYTSERGERGKREGAEQKVLHHLLIYIFFFLVYVRMCLFLKFDIQLIANSWGEEWGGIHRDPFFGCSTFAILMFSHRYTK